MELHGKVILITGASGGIGSATARHLASKGMNLALAGRDIDSLKEVANVCRNSDAKAEIFPGEITDEQYLDGLGEAVKNRFGAIHALFNNAGIAETGPVVDADLSSWDTVLDVNFRSLLHLTKAFLPHLLEHPESAVINLSSIAGRMTYAGGGIYSSTKHAVNAFSGCLFEDMRDQGLKVASICPGFVDTKMTSAIPGNRANMIQPEDVARTVSFVLQFPANACPTEIVIRPQFPLQ